MNSTNIFLKADKTLYSLSADSIFFIVVSGKYCHVFTAEREYVVRSPLINLLDGPLGDCMLYWNRSMAYNPEKVTGFTLSEMCFDKFRYILNPTFYLEFAKFKHLHN